MVHLSVRGVETCEHHWLLQQTRMVLADPSFHAPAQLPGQANHLLGLLVGHQPGSFVAANVPFLAELFELSDGPCIGADGLGERLDDSIVVRISCGTEASRRQSRRCQLERGVVGNVEPPVGTQARRGAVGQITIGDAEQVSYFLSAWLVIGEPAVFQPILQAHARPPARRSWGCSKRW